MIKRLYIRNFTLIDELDIEFHSGFSVITGETGAGKSIILGAIGLLMGNRADSKQIKNGQDKCVIEAHFDLSKYNMADFFNRNDIDFEADDTIIRRELTASGKSRAFINDTPVSLSVMRELGESLIDIHSQHQNLLLQKEDFQLNVIDIIGEDNKQLTAYKQGYDEFRKSEKTLEELKNQIASSKENEEFMRFQFNEIQQANLQLNQQEELEQTSETLSHSEEIKTALFESNKILNGEDNGVVEKMKTAVQQLESIKDVYPNIKDIADRMNSAHIELKDIADEINNDIEQIDFDPNELDKVNQQLDTIYTLEQKFHVTSIQELLDIQKDLKEKLNNIDNSDEELQTLQLKVNETKSVCEKQATSLSSIRKKAAKKVEEEMKSRLIPLGIPNVRFQVEISSKPLSNDGSDKINFLFSANKSTAMQPVSQVASGGEIARVMLSLKAMISGTVKLPTIIFDEIDTGVSGKTAEMMAQIMKEMGKNDRQVISITHLPQIAAMGSTHYKVSKKETPQGTVSHMTMLSQEERIKEIAQMLSGSNISDAAISNAKALLGL
nr:DNA repair protein RecN [Prevotella sp.]